MENSEVYIGILSAVVALGLSIVGFFLKKESARLDKCASKSDVDSVEKELKSEIKSIQDGYARKEDLERIEKRMDKIDEGIEKLVENTVRNVDFIRITTRLESKLDDIIRG